MHSIHLECSPTLLDIGCSPEEDTWSAYDIIHFVAVFLLTNVDRKCFIEFLEWPLFGSLVSNLPSNSIFAYCGYLWIVMLLMSFKEGCLRIFWKRVRITAPRAHSAGFVAVKLCFKIANVLIMFKCIFCFSMIYSLRFSSSPQCVLHMGSNANFSDNAWESVNQAWSMCCFITFIWRAPLPWLSSTDMEIFCRRRE